MRLNHPLNLTKSKIEIFCAEHAIKYGQQQFKVFDKFSPLVDTKSCFDDLRIPKDHESRKRSDTYYVSDDMVLRTHTSAHQCQLLRSGVNSFLCTGDVYRRDEIDSTHYPVFHQMEGVRLFSDSELQGGNPREVVEEDLKRLLSGLARRLFGDNCEIRWREDYFPFTEPSFELDVKYEGEWLELLGCGLIHPDVLENAGLGRTRGAWAFGLGLERLAMVLYKIPDIRLFWSEDNRFLDQFNAEKDAKQQIVFSPYSKYPPCYKDISFWLPETALSESAGVCEERKYHVNNLFELIRSVTGDLCEQVTLIDRFTHPKTGRLSEAWRIVYRHMDRSLTNEEVDSLQWKLREQLPKVLDVTLR